MWIETLTDHYKLASFLSAALLSAISLFLFVRARENPLARWFAVYLLTIGGWAACWNRMISAESASSALFWARSLHFPAAFIPATFLSLIHRMAGAHRGRALAALRAALYLFGVTSIAVAFHPSFVDTAAATHGFRFYLIGGPWYTAYIIAFGISTNVAFMALIYESVRARGPKKRQLTYTLFAYSVCYLGGITVFFPHFDIGVPRYALYSIPVGHVMILYAIVKHRLLNVRIVMRRAGLLALIYGLLALFMIPLFASLNERLALAPAGTGVAIAVQIVLSATLLSVGPFLYAYLIRRSSYFQEHTMAGLTHELKGPLAAIEGAIQILSEQARQGAQRQDQNAYLEMIERNASRLRLFVNELLHVYRLQDRESALEIRRVDMRALCADVVSGWSEAARTKGVAMSVEDAGGPVWVNCDDAKIRQVVSNLVSNALKFTSQGRVVVEAADDGDQVVVSVTDTGAGISPKDLPRIFDRFYQGSAGVSAKGTGIGLAIAKAWIEAHDGEIRVDSEPGKGSRFRFSIPKI